MHKLGRGKPLGLGSVKICVTGIIERCADNGEYRMRQVKPQSCLGINYFDTKDESFDDYMLLTNYHLADGLEVRYPLADNGSGSKNAEASHQWFAGNRTMGEGGKNPMTPSIKYSLPMISMAGDDGAGLLLPKLVKTVEDVEAAGSEAGNRPHEGRKSRRQERATIADSDAGAKLAALREQLLKSGN
jgi:hypothetical protein